MGKTTTRDKERMKALKVFQNSKKLEAAESNPKEAEISKLKFQITSCEYDLKNSFAGNKMIIQKLELLKERLKGLS